MLPRFTKRTMIMPIYAYKCHTCGKDFEVQARMSDPTPDRGEDCTSSLCQLEKVMSPVSISVASGGGRVSNDSQQATVTAKPAHSCGFGCKH
ncbi:zinc ribbon domain-containing protein [bacterium]|nr:zinc ribbon domain-containing protein [bacterium]